MRIKEIMEAVMSVGIQSKYPISAGARSLMGSRWRYDRAVKDNVKQTLVNAVDQLEQNLKHIPKTDYDHINMLMQTICEKFRVEPAELHNAFVKKFNCSPDNYAIKYKKSREGKPINV
jgi:ribosomal protein S18